jgi:hypothetical protein
VAPIADPSLLQPLPSDLPEESAALQNPVQPLGNGSATLNTEAASRAEVERTTRLFVERFGSYSNFSNFENITSLQGIMTDSMRSYARTFMQQDPQNATAGYSGVNTRLIGLRISQFELNASATVEITVLEEKQAGLSAPVETRYRDGRVELRFQGGQWLIHGLFYEN